MHSKLKFFIKKKKGGRIRVRKKERQHCGDLVPKATVGRKNKPRAGLGALAWGPDGREGAHSGGRRGPALSSVGAQTEQGLKQDGGTAGRVRAVSGSNSPTETSGSVLHFANQAPHPQAPPPSMGHPMPSFQRGVLHPLPVQWLGLGLWWEGST